MARYFRSKKSMKKSRPRSRRPKGNFRKKVLAVIHSQIENKQAAYNATAVSYNSGINIPADALGLIPSVPNGLGNGQRVGDKINLQSLRVKGHLELNQFPVGTLTNFAAGTILPNTRICVRLMMVQPKRYHNVADAIANNIEWMPYILKNGVSDQAFTGLVQDLYLPINRDTVTVYYDKLIYLNIPQQTLVGTPTNAMMTTSLGKSVKFFSHKFRLRNKKLSYDDFNSGQCNNFAPLILLGFSHLDASSPDTITTPVTMSYTSSIEYEDA